MYGDIIAYQSEEQIQIMRRSCGPFFNLATLFTSIIDGFEEKNLDRSATVGSFISDIPRKENMKKSIRRKPQIQNTEERLANAIARYHEEGPMLLERLHEEIQILRLVVDEKGLNNSQGKAERLVNALR